MIAPNLDGYRFAGWRGTPRCTGSELTLAQGAILLWPNVATPMSQALLKALSRHTGIPIDVPYQRLSAKQRRQVLYGTGEEWIAVTKDDWPAKTPAAAALKFQFKGLYPALEEASKLSVRLRSTLDHLIGEIECSECGGSRLKDDASAVTFRERVGVPDDVPRNNRSMRGSRCRSEPMSRVGSSRPDDDDGLKL